MSGLETKHNEVTEVPSHQQSDENDARVLHALGYNQGLRVSTVTSGCTPKLYADEILAQVRAVVKLGFDDNGHGYL